MTVRNDRRSVLALRHPFHRAVPASASAAAAATAPAAAAESGLLTLGAGSRRRQVGLNRLRAGRFGGTVGLQDLIDRVPCPASAAATAAASGLLTFGRAEGSSLGGTGHVCSVRARVE